MDLVSKAGLTAYNAFAAKAMPNMRKAGEDGPWAGGRGEGDLEGRDRRLLPDPLPGELGSDPRSAQAPSLAALHGDRPVPSS